VQRGYKEDNWGDPVRDSRVKVGSNTSTVALRVVGGDEREPTAWRYNGATLSLGDKYADLALQVGGVSNLRQ
jgi:hypothetical protein